MQNIALPALLVAAWCLGSGCAAHDYSSYGTHVYLTPMENGPSEEEMDEALEYFFEACPRAFGADEAKLRNRTQELRIIWEDELIPCDLTDYETRYPEQSYDGCAGTASGDWIHVVWSYCIGQTALYHELGHWVRTRLLGRQPDMFHDDADFWAEIVRLNAQWNDGLGWEYCSRPDF